MESDEEKSQKIQIIGFTTNEKSFTPNDLLSIYLDNYSHFIIKKNKQLTAFSTVLPEHKKSTKIMLCTLFDLSLEYEGINDVNCYLIIIDLQKEPSREKYDEILAYIKTYCDLSKKIYILGIKKEEEGNKIKIKEEEIDQKIQDLNVDYEYFELNIDNSIEVSEKILEIFKYSFNNSISDNLINNDNEGRSCNIY